jgi:putative Holliday junction resolvase
MLLPHSFDQPYSSAAAPARILALDVGKKRIGLAISDELGITAQGLETLHRTRIRDDLARLTNLIQARGVTLLLIGRPLHMTGSESRQSVYTEEFAARLSEHCGVPTLLWDERLTTLEAERVLRLANAPLDERKRAVDRLSAVLLLESYLENQQIARAGANDEEPGIV